MYQDYITLNYIGSRNNTDLKNFNNLEFSLHDKMFCRLRCYGSW